MKILENTYGKNIIYEDEKSSTRNIIALAKPGYSFLKWSTDIDGIDEYQQSINIPLSSNGYLYANFIADKPYDIVIQQNSNGYAYIEEINEKYNKKIIAIPDNGYKFSRWIEISSSNYINNFNKCSNPLSICMTQQYPNMVVQPLFEYDPNYTQIAYSDGSFLNIYIDGTLSASYIKTNSGYTHNKKFLDSTIISVKLGDKVDAIGEKCFMNCISLSSVEINNQLRNIGEYAFSNTSLTDFDFSKLNCNCIPSYAFSRTKLSTLGKINESISSISKNAFYKCTQLDNISSLSSVAYIDKYAFFKCNAKINDYLKTLSCKNTASK